MQEEKGSMYRTIFYVSVSLINLINDENSDSLLQFYFRGFANFKRKVVNVALNRVIGAHFISLSLRKRLGAYKMSN